jgi:predicted signal transduction protein with EAL and GGDEF domain
LREAGQALSVAQKILARLAEPVRLHGQELHLTASIGVAVFPENGEDPETLIKRADLAMYRAKQAGKNRVAMFTIELDQAIRRRVSLEEELRKGLERGEMSLYYQPRLDLDSGRVVGVEALLRWRPASGGLRLPGEFIDVAHASGLIVPIGREVLRMAFHQAVSWHRAGHERLSMAVNVSELQIQDAGLTTAMRTLLEESGLDPRSVELEIAESSFARLNGTVAEIVEPLCQLGVQITLDNFGTSCSFMRLLRQLPVSCVKIDRSFVSGLPADPDDSAIARAIICLARRLELNVVAEGVTSTQQLDFLSDAGCHQIQGYLFCPPLPAEHIDKLLGMVHEGFSRSRSSRPASEIADHCDCCRPTVEAS